MESKRVLKNGGKLFSIISASGENGFFGSSFKEEEINDFVNMENCQFFSGGEKIKITIAALLTKSSDIYLLDEPASALDKVSIERLKALLAKCKNAGAAMIVVHGWGTEMLMGHRRASIFVAGALI